MEIIQTNKLTSKQFQDAKALIELCRLTDGTRGINFLENDTNAIADFPAFYLMYQENILVSVLSVFLPNEKECEIYANTLPRYRKKGYFRQLYLTAEEQLKKYGISHVFFANEPKCHAGSESLRCIGAYKDTSEYMMSYRMETNALPKGILTFHYEETEDGEIAETYWDSEKVASVHLFLENKVATIYDFEVLPKYRGRRFGVETLLLTVQHLKEMGCCKILLHVSSSNKIACRLYLNHGFVHVEQLDYWRKLI